MNLSPADIAQKKVDIEAVYQRIFAQQMQSLPFVSPHIEIEMVSLQPYQLKSSAHIQSVQLDYQRISIEPCLIGLTQSQVMQRIGQLISLCPVSHQVASLASFSVAQATTCPEISVEQQTQLKQEWINTYAMQWMQVAQRLNLTSLWAPIIRLLLTGQHQAGIEAMLQLDSADIQDWLATEKFDAAAIDFAPSSPMFELWQWAKHYTWDLGDKKWQQLRIILNAESLGEGKISESKIGESKIANHALCGVMWIKLQQLVKLVYQQSALGLPAAPTFVAYAPRGRLIHQVKCNKQAEVTHYTIQSPTDALCTTGLIELLTECPLPSHQPRLGLNLLLAFIDPCVPFEVSLNFDETV